MPDEKQKEPTPDCISGFLADDDEQDEVTVAKSIFDEIVDETERDESTERTQRP